MPNGRGHWLVRLVIPKVLVCSQLPVSVDFPVSFTLKLEEQQAAGEISALWGQA
jgi:hypothetical protein